MCRRSLLYLALGLFCFPLSALGQITVPAKVAPFKPIKATLAANLPPGAQIRGGWVCSSADLVEVDANTIHIWAPPGVHHLVARGVWVVTKTVTLPPDQTFEALVDFGQYDYTAEFEVAAAGPPVPPPLPGNRRGIIVEETSKRTPDQARLFLEIRKALPDQLLPIIDRSDPPASLSAAVTAAGSSLPALVVTAADGSVVRALPLPATVDAIQGELAR